MSKAAFAFTDKQSNQTVDVIEFDLIDNPGCRAWQYAVMLNSPVRKVYQSSSVLYTPEPGNHAKELYQQLQLVITSLSVTEFPVEAHIPESVHDASQQLMNQLHRHFTNSCRTLWNLEHQTSPDPQLDYLLHELNRIVHELEQYCPTDQKIKYHGHRNEIWIINDGKELGYDIFPFRQFHSYEHADLILDSYILGKTLIESFVCDDDPSSWDTSGHMKTNGGAVIQLDTLRQNIYNTPEFADWLNQHKVTREQKLADFPLGYFVSGHRHKAETIKKDLHKYSCSVSIKL